MSVELLDVIQPSVFKGQLAAGSVTDTVIQAGTKGLVITLKIGKNGFVLGRTRGGIRYFHAIDGAASVLAREKRECFFFCPFVKFCMDGLRCSMPLGS